MLLSIARSAIDWRMAFSGTSRKVEVIALSVN
jgi:hypothetical protein